MDQQVRERARPGAQDPATAHHLRRQGRSAAHSGKTLKFGEARDALELGQDVLQECTRGRGGDVVGVGWVQGARINLDNSRAPNEAISADQEQDSPTLTARKGAERLPYRA